MPADELEWSAATWPVAIVQARYDRCWYAIPRADAEGNAGLSPLDDGIWTTDAEAMDYVRDNAWRFGRGATPVEAYDDMMSKLGGGDADGG